MGGTEWKGSLVSSRAPREATGLERKAQVQPQSMSKHLLRQATMEMKDF